MKDWFDLRPPGNGIWLLALLYIVAPTIVLSAGEATEPIMFWACVIMIPMGIGLWLKHEWARFASLILCGLAVIVGILAIGLKGFSLRLGIKILFAMANFRALWEWDVIPQDSECEAM